MMHLHEKIDQLMIYQISDQDRNIIIIDVMQVIAEIAKLDSTIEVQLLGPSQTIVEVVFKKKKYSFTLFVISLVVIIFWFHAHDYEFS